MKNINKDIKAEWSNSRSKFAKKLVLILSKKAEVLDE